jgi:putative membrane protein
MNRPLLIGSVAAVLAVWAWSATRVSVGRLLATFAAMSAVGWLAEFAGMRWGVPFGQAYRYHDALTPTVAGVPLFVPLAWFVIAQTAVNLSAERPGRRPLLTTALLGGLFVGAHRLLLDPLAVSADAWQWSRGGAWFTTPWSNVAGWLLVGCALCGVGGWLTAGRSRAGSPAPRLEASCLLMYLALMTAATLSAWHRLGSVLPGVVALAVAGPYWWRLLSRRSIAGEPGRA